MHTVRTGLAGIVVGLATALLIVAVSLLVFLNPIWVGFEQGRAEATAWTGFSEADLRTATDAILADLVLGPPDFDVAVAGTAVLNERERSHMRDVRSVFFGFFALTVIAAVAGLAIALRRREAARAATWRSVRTGAVALIAAIVAAGIVAVTAFDMLFEVFHQLLFSGGSYTFDPASERLVQLFSFAFWQETAIALGAVCLVVAAIVAILAHRRASMIEGSQVGEAAPGQRTSASGEAASEPGA